MELQLMRIKALGVRRVFVFFVSLLQLRRNKASEQTVKDNESAIQGLHGNDAHGRKSPTEAAKA